MKRDILDWKKVYEEQAVETMPWYCLELDADIKNALNRLGLRSGKILDLGSGPGTQAMALARIGFDVTAADISPKATQDADLKAKKEGLSVRFVQDDILKTRLQDKFDVIVDRGCFHVFHTEQRAAYLKSIRTLLKPQGHLLLKCFSDEETSEDGPYRFSKNELRDIFDAFEIKSIEPAMFKGATDFVPKAWMCVMQNLEYRIETILSFWFGELKDNASFPDEKYKIWFKGGEEVDRLIKKDFEEDLLRAKRGSFDDWDKTPQGRLALIILLDQFSRNLYQDARAFEQDEKALSLTEDGIAAGDDLKLKIVERWFFYMPFMHAEDMKAQRKCIDLFTKLADQSPPAIEIPIRHALDYGMQHLKIIERFGRYPHRNSALGRETTAEEAEFLKTPNSSF